MFVHCSFGQDPHFSQFYANPVYLAPSFAGGSDGARFVVNFRDQWPKVKGNFLTYSFSADQQFDDFNSGLGIFAVSESAGSGKLVTTNVGLAYSYKLNINRNFIFRPGLAAYYYDRYIDYSIITFADEYFGDQYIGSTSEILPDNRVQHADFAISALAYVNQYWFGINVDHLMNISPELRSDFRYSNVRVSAFGGYKYVLPKRVRDKKNEYIHFAFQYYYQSQASQLNIGFYYNRNPLVLGLWYRGIPVGNEMYSADALIFLGGLKYNGYVFSYSYDMTLGKLISRTGGSHEISIIYTIKQAAKGQKKYKSIPCPEF